MQRLSASAGREERAEKARQEDERIRKERMAALAKEDAVLMLQRYVTREENNLKDTIEECKLKLQSVDVDQQSLSDEQLALEKEEELKPADARKRKVKRRDGNERVGALLRSPTLNRLANSYLGEDLSDDLAKFKSHIRNSMPIPCRTLCRRFSADASIRKTGLRVDVEGTTVKVAWNGAV